MSLLLLLLLYHMIQLHYNSSSVGHRHKLEPQLSGIEVTVTRKLVFPGYPTSLKVPPLRLLLLLLYHVIL